MARKGRRPVPTKLRLLRGNPRRRPVNKDEPKPRANLPRCPSWLSPDAKLKWKQLVPELRNMGVLSRADGDALTNYCQVWARWKEAEEFIQKTGSAYPVLGDNGKVKYIQQVPQVAIARNLLLMLNRIQQEFGLTPSSRSALTVPSKPKADKFSDFMGRKQA